MDRLTDKRFLGEGFYQPKSTKEFKELQLAKKPSYDELYQRLGELENKLENGTLLETVCSPGDIIYRIERFGIGGRETKVVENKILSAHVVYDICDTDLKKGVLKMEENEIGLIAFSSHKEAAKRAEELAGVCQNCFEEPATIGGLCEGCFQDAHQFDDFDLDKFISEDFEEASDENAKE